VNHFLWFQAQTRATAPVQYSGTYCFWPKSDSNLSHPMLHLRRKVLHFSVEHVSWRKNAHHLSQKHPPRGKPTGFVFLVKLICDTQELIMQTIWFKLSIFPYYKGTSEEEAIEWSKSSIAEIQGTVRNQNGNYLIQSLQLPRLQGHEEWERNSQWSISSSAEIQGAVQNQKPSPMIWYLSFWRLQPHLKEESIQLTQMGMNP
jgi:hypothetical protein